MAQGWLPTKPPLGYKTDGEKGHKIHVIDEEISPLIKKMFDLYASGQYSTKTLCNAMYERGLRSRTGHKVSHARIHQLLGDPFYYGMSRWKNQITPGHHEPLISKELFQKVQDRLHSYGAPRMRKHNSLFKSVFRCSECGGIITWEIQKGHWYGHGNHYKNCPNYDWVKQEDINAQVAKSVVDVSREDKGIENMLSWVQDALKESHAGEIAFREKSSAELERRYQTATQRIDKLYDDKIDGRISTDFYDKKLQQYKKEQEETLDSLNRHRNANLKYFEMGVAVLQIAEEARDTYLKPRRTVEQKRTLLSFLFSNPKINGKNVEISYQKAFKLIHNRVQQELSEKNTKKSTFEPAKKPTNKEKSAALRDTHPIWLRTVNSVRTIIQRQNEYIYIPDLREYANA